MTEGKALVALIDLFGLVDPGHRRGSLVGIRGVGIRGVGIRGVGIRGGRRGAGRSSR